MKETLDAVKLRRDDDQNPDALTLRRIGADQRWTDFANLATADPTSLLAENNLAVIAAGQKQTESFVHYGRRCRSCPTIAVAGQRGGGVERVCRGGGDKNSTAQRRPRPMSLPRRAWRRRWTRRMWCDATWVTKVQREQLMERRKAAQSDGATGSRRTRRRAMLASIDVQIKQATADLQHPTTTPSRPACGRRPCGAGGGRVRLVALGRGGGDHEPRTDIELSGAASVQFDQLVAGDADSGGGGEVEAAFPAGRGAALGQYMGVQRIIDLGETETPPAARGADPKPIADACAPA